MYWRRRIKDRLVHLAIRNVHLTFEKDQHSISCTAIDVIRNILSAYVSPPFTLFYALAKAVIA